MYRRLIKILASYFDDSPSNTPCGESQSQLRRRRRYNSKVFETNKQLHHFGRVIFKEISVE